jgi:alpha-galactosidase
MASLRVLASHDRAGSVVPTRLAVRASEAEPEPDGSLPPGPTLPLVCGRHRSGPLELEVDLASDTQAATARVQVRNASDGPVHLESVIVGFRWLGAGAASLRFLKHGWQSWSFTGARDLDPAGEPEFPSGAWLRGMHHARGAVPADRAGWHESDLVTVAGSAAAGPTCLLGVLEEGDSFGVLYLRRDGSDLLLEAELCVDARLAPGETRGLELVRVALGVDPVALLEEQARLHGLVNDARTARPFLAGWCSWYHFFHDVSEGDVVRNLEALAASRDQVPVDVVLIDDGYQSAIGDWLDTNPKFPRGLEPLARDIRDAGFTPGLWTAPFCAVPDSRLARAHPDWLLRREGQPFRGLLHPEWSADASVFVLDASREAVLDHLTRVFADLVALGFDYLKLDFLYTAAMRADAADPTVSRASRLRRGLSAIRRGAGPAATLLGCGCPLGAAVGVVDAMRIGPDVAPTWEADPKAAIPGIEAAQPSTRSAVRSVLARSWIHRRLWVNDPDCLMARGDDTQLGPGERRALAVAIAVTGGLPFLSDDVPLLSEADRRLYRETRALAARVDALGIPGAARAIGLLAGETPRGAHAATPEGGWVALLNTADEAAKLRVDLSAQGLGDLEGVPEPALGSGEVAVDGEGCLEQELPARDGGIFQLKRKFPMAVFCDFDGTFSVQDVGATLAQRVVGDRRPAAWARFERGEITAWEYNLEILDGLPLPEDELQAFLRTIELDPGARDLVAWCESHGVPFRVLSDGFDYNLNRLQVLHDVSFHYEANRLRYENDCWRIEGAHPNPRCGCGTGTCKRGRIDEFRAEHPGVTTVHIGNGRVSDTCGALAADVAFAKDSLAEELTRRGVEFEAFDTLHDVVSRLQVLLDEGGCSGRVSA